MAKKKLRNLVIVESPAKARTLAGLLGPEYDVHASVGHVRDLPKTKLGVDIDDGFAPRYVVPREKQKVVRQLKAAAEDADRVYLATDPDREGEAIAWHVVAAAGLERMPHQRVVFHEVTKNAVLDAFEHPREINERLVDAQQARRILDRLVGYKISPLLWSKVRRGLSAGRVQSVALRMVVEREKEITAFVPQEYWTIDAKLAKASGDATLTARLTGLAGTRKKLELGSAAESEHLLALLRPARFVVASVRKKEQHQRPQPPFTTSSLQQEASRRLGFTAKRTMALAQQLYEGLSVDGSQVGLITYMRTDSTNIASSALEDTRAFIAGKYGSSLVPPAPRVFRKKAKGAQEAHEAIRPTSVHREPASLKAALNRDQMRLYALIWQRMVASQMADAIYDQTTVDVEAQPKDGHDRYLFRVTRSVLRFPGYRQLYQDTTEEGEGVEEKRLPPLVDGEELRLLELVPEQHFTEPPPRFTEATLVKAMEENGIGRPSTYAPILSTLQDRGYVEKDGRALKPKELGVVVNDLLTSYFPEIIDIGFTAEMEGELDEIAEGQRRWQPVVHDFYEPLKAALSVAEGAPPVQEETSEVCDKCGRPMVIRWGRFGRFLACSGFPECKNSRPLAGQEEEAPQATDEVCPVCGKPMVIRRGRFGPFLACSDYPTCRGTRRLLAKVGVACPECGGDIVAKRSKRGRTFYGCSNYPRCRFTSWSRPLAQPCPQCSGVIVAQAGRKAKCLKCGWRGAPPTRTPAEVTTA